MNKNDFYNAIKEYAEFNHLAITIEDSPFTLGPTITFEGPLVGTIRYDANLVENDPYVALKKMFRAVDSRLGKRTSITYDELFKQKAPKPVPYIPKIKNVIFNEPATIVIWSDGTKTVVKCQEGERYDPEKGLAMAISKKALGNMGNYCEVFKKWLPEEEVETERDPIGVFERFKKTMDGLGFTVEVVKEELENSTSGEKNK